jgi:hypothetical protein
MPAGTNVAFENTEEARMKLIGATLGIVAMCTVGASAQTSTTKTEEKTKIEVKDGREVKIIGCVERNPSGGYMLTNLRTGEMKYALVTNDDLSKHLGHLVQVKGEATDRGGAKVKIESKVKGTTGDNKDGKREVKTEHRGDLGLHYLGLKSLKMISTSCM